MTKFIIGALLIGLIILPTNPAQAGAGKPELQLSERIDISIPRLAPVQPPPRALNLRSSPRVRESIIRELVLLKGTSMLGTDYVLGANDSEAVDCSALVQQMFGSAGIELPRTSRELAAVGTAVRASDLAPGDLLFYRWGKRGLHVGVYMDDGVILHASTGRREVVMSRLNKAWQRRMVTARRPI